MTLANNYPTNVSPETLGLGSGEITYDEYKKLIKEALSRHFETKSIAFGNKSIKIDSNTYRVDADVVPAFCHQRYHGASLDECIEGVAFYSDNNDLIINWPEQNYENGVEKNKLTSRRYKRVVRILKRLKPPMIQAGIGAADIPSYLVECLVWNVPNQAFGHDLYYHDMRYVLAHLFNATMDNKKCSEWGEVNELKYLFRDPQPWTRQQAHNFISAVWNYIGYQ